MEFAKYFIKDLGFLYRDTDDNAEYYLIIYI